MAKNTLLKCMFLPEDQEELIKGMKGKYLMMQGMASNSSLKS